MPQQCSICCHPQREAIEASIVAQMPLRRIASQFETSDATLRRHRDHCIKPAIEAVQVERKEHFVWNLFAEMKWLHDETRDVHKAAKDASDYNATVKALGEARQQMKLFSELLQGNEPGQAEKLEAEWILVREAIFVALEPYPEARLAVAEALFALGRADDHDAGQRLLQAATPNDAS